MIHPFLDSSKIVTQRLAKNPHPAAVEILREYDGNAIDFGELSSNETPGAISLMMERTRGKLNDLQIKQLSSNKGDEAVDLLLSGEIPIDWINFSVNSNPRAVAHMKENAEKICWANLNRNSNPDICDLLDSSKISPMICFNESDRALEILDSNPRHIVSYLVVGNPNPNALELVKKHNLLTSVLYSPTPLAMNNLAKSTNPAAIDLLIQNLDRFHWREIFANPSPIAVDLVSSCYTGTWRQKCPYMPIDLRDRTEEWLHFAMDNWAVTEMCRNTNPKILDILRDSRDIDYGILSENPVIFI